MVAIDRMNIAMPFGGAFFGGILGSAFGMSYVRTTPSVLPVDAPWMGVF